MPDGTAYCLFYASVFAGETKMQMFYLKKDRTSSMKFKQRSEALNFMNTGIDKAIRKPK